MEVEPLSTTANFMHEVDITVIGAGVVGLAITSELVSRGREVLVIEKNQTFGQETSSRNSQVIHAGLYYPPGTLKARTCVEGNSLLYTLGEREGIAFKRTGKLIVATDTEEVNQLELLYDTGKRNGVQGLEMLSGKKARQMEPHVCAVAALFSPSSGIIDVHALMRYFVTKIMEGSAQITYKTCVIGIEKGGAGGYRVQIADPGGSVSFMTGVVINSAGLYSDKVAELAGLDPAAAGYKLHYCKGEYFRLAQGKRHLVERLVYPVPAPQAAGLGIHVTPGLDGTLLLGPDTHYVDNIDYSVSGQQQAAFYHSVQKFLPDIQYDDLQPEMAGIRPKLQGPRDDFRDFVIRDEGDKGLPGFINLIGIESPGLTAAPAIAGYVSDMVTKAP
jgi:L-2-hydroxyglutarate oxidase LhgO